MFTEHVGNLQAATSLEELKQVLEQVLGDCEAALTHDGTLRLNGALPAGAKDDAVLYVKNGYIAPNDATTEPDGEDNLPNGWAGIFDGGLRVKGQFKADQGVGMTFTQLLDLFPVGFQMPWYSTSNIPTGWAIMDGTSNAAGSGINRGGKVGYGYISGDPTFGTLGGAVAIALATSFSGTGNVTTSSVAAHIHDIVESEFDAKVTINTPSLSHAGLGSGTVLTNYCIFGVDDSPTQAVFDGTTAPDSNYLNDESTPGEVTIQGHRHTISAEAISDSFGPHTAAACTTTFADNIDTGSAGAHDHTASISTIAAGISIGTPSTVRPPGVVELWIEKIS